MIDFWCAAPLFEADGTLVLCVKKCLIVVLLGAALYYDITKNKVKNMVTLPASLCGLAINTYDQGLDGLWFSIQGCFTPVISLMVFYYINVMGAGDIKLFASIGAVMGLPFVAASFVFSVYIGAVIGAVVLVRKKIFVQTMKHTLVYITYLLSTRKISAYSAKEDKKTKFNFTVAIVPGTLIQLIAALNF